MLNYYCRGEKGQLHVNFHLWLYGTSEYGNSYIIPNLDNRVGEFLRILIFVHFLIMHYYFLS